MYLRIRHSYVYFGVWRGQERILGQALRSMHCVCMCMCVHVFVCGLHTNKCASLCSVMYLYLIMCSFYCLL